MDNSGTPHEDGRWLTYAELAEMRGITRKAAIRLTQRHQWRRQPGNDGAARVFVPADSARRQTPRDDATPGAFPAKALAALEDAVSALRGQLAAAEARAQTTDTDRRTAEARAERAEQGRDGERQRADVLRARIDALNAEMVTVRTDLEAERDAARAEAKGAAQAAEALRRSEAARKARGLVARLRAAWRGE